jgi:hypothetical protein
VTTAPKNIAISVRDRLTHRARERRENAQLLMTRYVIERLLYPLSRSSYCDHFVLKGAMLFGLWAPTPHRATGDLDLLGAGDNAPARLVEIFTEGFAADVEDDGVVFRPASLRAALAREEDQYSGVRLNFDAGLAGARLPIHVDIGYGDVITPGAVEIEDPTLLPQPAPTLRAYPPESVVAEKLQAMVALGMLNSRIKDFFDIWAIAGAFAFEGPVLARAVQATFARRETPVPAEPPIALTAAFAAAKQVQWVAFLRRTEIALAPEPLPQVQSRIASLVIPVLQSLSSQTAFDLTWPPGGPWA